MQYQYQAQELMSLLQQLRQGLVSGALYLTANINLQQENRDGVLVWYQGEITYGGPFIPDSQSFTRQVGKVFKPAWIDSALKFTEGKINQPGSTQELTAMLVKMRVFEWHQVESWMQNQVVCFLEQILPFSGQARLDPEVNFDLRYGDDEHGLDWQQLEQALEQRRQEWQSLSPVISSMEHFPYLVQELSTIPDPKVQKHIEQWIDGKRSLLDIAIQVNQDPLKLAKIYCPWVKAGWIKFSNSTVAENTNLPTILSVDDSPIIQTMIKRALGDYYQVLMASSAIEALNLLNQNGDQISLLILDLTMPDIDGLELCRTIRNIPRFRGLPVIMLTARDGLIDRIKGQLAGTNHYLTKPFEAEKLLELVRQYI